MTSNRGLMLAGEGDLADGSAGLGLLQRQDTVAEVQHLATQRDGAGGDEDHIRPARLRLGYVEGEGGEPVLFQAGLAVDQQRRADLDDQPFRGADVRGLKCHGCHGAVSFAGASAVMVA